MSSNFAKRIFSKNFLFLILSQLLIIWVSYINIIPKEHFFSSGDVVQIYNLPKIIRDLLYTWYLSGEGYFLLNFSYVIYYAFFFFITLLSKINLSQQSFLYYYIFLFFSFWSFYFSLNFYPLFKKNTKFWHRIALSLIYAFNIQTFNNFYTGLGYTPLLSLYILIPLIFAITCKYFEEEKLNLKLLACLGIIFFLCGIPAGNFAFFVILNILLFIFNLSLFFLIRRMKLIGYIKRFFFYYLVFFLGTFWAVIPQIVHLLVMRTNFNNNYYVFDIGSWILWQATKFPNPFFIVWDIIWYTQNFSPLVLLSIILPLVMVMGILLKKTNRLIISSYLFLLVFDILILNKGKGFLSDQIILLFFNNIFFSALRGADKSLIFLPFFFLISFFLSFKNDKMHGFLTFLLLFTSLLSVFPFFVGGIQTKYRIKADSSHSTLHIMPQEYIDSANQLNLSKLDDKVMAGPYSVINSVGWVNYPKWGVVGVDPTFQLYNKPIVHMNNFGGSFGKWNYGEYWNNQNPEGSKWILPFFGLLNANYFIYHKDVDPKFLEQTIFKIEFYENKGFIKTINKNNYFNLYKINSDYFLPHFYIPQNIIYSNWDIEILPEIVGLPGYQMRSAIFLADNADKSTEDTEKARRTLESRVDEVFVKSELKNAVTEEELGMTVKPEEISLPYVRQKPGSLFYYLVLKKEQFDKWKVRKEPEKLFEKHLFYANKMVSEIMAFGVNEPILANYKKEMTDVLGILKKLKQEGSKDFVKLLAKYEGTLWGQREKIKGIENLTDWDNTFQELDGQTEELKIKRDFSKLVYKIEIPKEGEYEIYVKDINGLTDYSLLDERNFEEGEQELVLPFSGISENLVDENLRIKDYSPNSIYRISFDYEAPKGGSFFVAEGKAGETAKTQLFSTGDEFRHFERFFQSSPDAQEAAVHLSISVSEEKNLRIERIYQPEVVLKNIQYSNFVRNQAPLISNIQYQSPKITFVKINPTKYRVKIEGAKEPYTLVFSESFHRGWKAYKKDIGNQILDIGEQKRYGEVVASYFDGEIKEGMHKNVFLDKNTFETWGKKPLSEDKHLMVNGYANSWYITPEDVGGKQDYELIIEFAPQRLFYKGLFISGITLAGCLIYLLYNSIIVRRNRQ